MSKPEASDSAKYLKYTGLAFQLFFTLAIFVWLGQYLDKKLELSNPWFTIVLILVGFFGWVAKLLKDLK